MQREFGTHVTTPVTIKVWFIKKNWLFCPVWIPFNYLLFIECFLINHLNNNCWRFVLFTSAALDFSRHLQKQKIMNLLRDRKGRDEESKENQSLPKDMIYDIMLCLPGKSTSDSKRVSQTPDTSILSDLLFHHNYFTQYFHQRQLKTPTLLGFFYKSPQSSKPQSLCGPMLQGPRDIFHTHVSSRFAYNIL